MSRSHFLNRDVGKPGPSHKRSKKQEKEIAKRGGGLLVSRSGAGAEKADVKKYNKVFRIEAKTTKNQSFSVTRKMIEVLESTALSHGELPAFIIEFIDEKGKPWKEVAVVPSYVLDSLNVKIYADR